MDKTQLLLREYEDRCWFKDQKEQRFVFDTEKERFDFITRLNEIKGAEYFLYQSKGCWKIDVFLENNILPSELK